MNIIGAAAQLNSGKDVFCDYLEKILNHNVKIWERTAFANAVKEVFQSSFNVDRKFIEDWKRESSPPPGMQLSVRKALQFIGDGFRQIKQDIWIEIAFRNNSKNKIFSDCRYFNEARAIKEKNGLMFLIYRPGFLNDDPNPSESQLKPLVEFCIKNVKEGPINNLDNAPENLKYYDFFLINNGTLEELYSKIDTIVIPFIKSKFGVKIDNTCNTMDNR